MSAEHASAKRFTVREDSIAAMAEGFDVVRVAFDAQYGYPVDLFVDPATDVGDDEIGYRTAVTVNAVRPVAGVSR